MTKQPSCPQHAKHKYEWQRDVTDVAVRTTSRGRFVTSSMRGVYECSCGAVRIGQPRSGL